MLSAPGFHAHSIAKSNLTLSLEASLAIPFKNICQENSQEKLKFSKLFQAQKAYHFFEQSFFFFFFERYSIQHRQPCGSISILQKTKTLFSPEMPSSSRFFWHSYHHLSLVI